MAQRADTRTTVEVGFPFQINSYGRIADPDYELHVQQMIELVLFTAPGERVNRPDFGCGLLEVLFGPDKDSMAAAMQYTIQIALQKWMGEVIAVKGVDVQPGDSTFRITLSYVLLRDRQLRVATFEPRGGRWGR